MFTRELKGYNIEELATVLGVSEPTITQWARARMRSEDRVYLSAAMAELYAEFKIVRPELFEKVKATILSGVVGQIRVLVGS